MSVSLCPTQHVVLKELARSIKYHPFVSLCSSSGLNSTTSLRGAGITTLLKALSSSSSSSSSCDSDSSCFLFLSIDKVASSMSASAQRSSGGQPPSAALPPEEAVLKAAVEFFKQESRDDDGNKLSQKRKVVIIDDIDLLASQNHEILQEGEGFMAARKTAPEPIRLLKALHDLATEAPHERAVLFYASSAQCLRYVSRPLVVTMPRLNVDDYKHLLSTFLGAEQASNVDVDELFFQFPQLGPADLRTACVPDPSSDITQSWDTNAVLSRVRHFMQGMGGALSVADVEPVEVSTFPGMQEVVDKLEVHVVSPFQNMVNGTSAKLGNKAPEPAQGVILYGPPGTGKTTVCRYLAHRLKSKFFVFRESCFDGGGRWELHDVFARAEAAAPSVLFVDDVDVLFHRGKVAWGGQGDLFRFMLTKLDGIASQSIKDQGKYVCVIMACNDLRILPEALVRSGRIELWVKTKRPNSKTRQKILRKWLNEEGGVLALTQDSAIKEVAEETEEWTCADMRRVVKDARNILAFEEAKADRALTNGDVSMGGNEPASKSPKYASDADRANALLKKAHTALKDMVEDVDFWKDARMAYT